jgi:hypothetical protein
MPSISTRSTRAIASSGYQRENPADMERAADGHRAPPRYPDGREFDLCDDTTKHLSEIRDPREDFGL